MSRLGRRELLGLALFVVVAVVALATSPDRALTLLAEFEDRPAQFVLLLCVVYLVRPLFAWPVVAVSTVVGFVLGPVLGLFVATVGVALTSLPPYLAACWFGTDTSLTARLSSHGQAYFQTMGDVRGMIAARFAPIPADATSAAAGLSGISIGPFLVGTVVGEFPWTVAAVLVGASARELNVGGLSGVSLPLVIATTLAGIALLAGPVYRQVTAGAGQTANR